MTALETLKDELQTYSSMITKGRKEVGDYDEGKDLNGLIDLCNDLSWACAFAMGKADAIKTIEAESNKAAG